MMRTTIELPDRLHRIAMGLAHHTGRSLSQTVTDLMERGLEQPPAEPPARGSRGFARHAATGLPVVRSARQISADDVKALEDEA